jgi:CheY-like chemotaxis protein
LRGVRVLIVDDNATNRRLLTEILKLWQMEPESASNADAAITAMWEARAAMRPFRIVLTDGHMPGTDGFMFAERIKADPSLTSAIIMMLSSGAYRDDPARCRKMGITAYLTKPIQQSELKQALMRMLQSDIDAPKLQPVATRHLLRKARATARVLLVEDNPVNQLLSKKMLEKYGYEVVTVANGLEALSLLEEQSFQLALVDVQMPEMDGLELTQAIRDRERISGSYLPIIAMTARALQGDREGCLVAGMDSYVSKPVDTKELLEAIESATRNPGPSRESS